MKDQVIRDFSSHFPRQESFRVIFKGRLCSSHFNSRGPALAYLQMLLDGYREPEFSILSYCRQAAKQRLES